MDCIGRTCGLYMGDRVDCIRENMWISFGGACGLYRGEHVDFIRGEACGLCMG